MLARLRNLAEAMTAAESAPCALHEINPFTAPSYASMTARGHRALLVAPAANEMPVAVGASVRDLPVGLALARVEAPRRAELVSVYVVPDHRGRGIGRRLVEALEQSLATRDVGELAAVYALTDAGGAPIERFLARCGWPIGTGRMRFFALDGAIMEDPWFKSAVLPDTYGISPWTTVTEAERGLLADRQASAWIPEALMPFRFEADLEPRTSLVLRHHWDLIGWVLTRRLNASTLHYSNLFVRPSRNRVGRTFAALALLADAVRRMTGWLGVRSQGHFEVTHDNAAMLRFIERHMAARLLDRRDLARVTKRVAAASGQGV